MQFSDLRLAEPILRAISEAGYVTATPVQEQAIPFILEGRDVLGCAQTGTGKTAAFALPILHRLAATMPAKDPAAAAESEPIVVRDRSPRNRGRKQPGRRSDRRFDAQAQAPRVKPAPPRCLVLCPTRELAVQIGESFRDYGMHLPIRGTVIYGGVSQRPQVMALDRGVEVIIATPGRLMDLMNQGCVDLSGIEVLVLDEADRMMDMGFINDIRKIIAELPTQRQTLFFSATMPPEIRELSRSILKDPAVIRIAAESPAVERIDQSVYFVEKKNKPTLLAHLMATHPMYRTIVFTRTKHGADRLVRHLHREGIKSEAIHGDKNQAARQRALNNFRSDKVAILVATDIASRGIDIDGITHVVNYDLSHEPDTYVHRIGRTARAGAEGAAISFCDRDEVSNLRAIERLIRRPIPIKQDHPNYPSIAGEPGGQTWTGPSARDSHAGGESGRQGGYGRPQGQSQGNRRGGFGGQREGGGRGFGGGQGGSAKGGKTPHWMRQSAQGRTGIRKSSRKG